MGNQDAAIALKRLKCDCKMTQRLRQRHAALGQNRIGKSVHVDSLLMTRGRVADAQLLPVQHVAIGRKGTPPELDDACIVEVAEHSVAAQFAKLPTVHLVRSGTSRIGSDTTCSG